MNTFTAIELLKRSAGVSVCMEWIQNAVGLIKDMPLMATVMESNCARFGYSCVMRAVLYYYYWTTFGLLTVLMGTTEPSGGLIPLLECDCILQNISLMEQYIQIYFHRTFVSRRLICTEPSRTLYCMTADFPTKTYSLMQEQIEILCYHIKVIWFIIGCNLSKPKTTSDLFG